MSAYRKRDAVHAGTLSKGDNFFKIRWVFLVNVCFTSFSFHFIEK